MKKEEFYFILDFITGTIARKQRMGKTSVRPQNTQPANINDETQTDHFKAGGYSPVV